MTPGAAARWAAAAAAGAVLLAGCGSSGPPPLPVHQTGLPPGYAVHGTTCVDVDQVVTVQGQITPDPSADHGSLPPVPTATVSVVDAGGNQLGSTTGAPNSSVPARVSAFSFTVVLPARRVAAACRITWTPLKGPSTPDAEGS